MSEFRANEHLQLLTLPELAARMRRTTGTLQKMRLPPCVWIAGKRLWFLADVQHLFEPDHGYRDAVGADELASCLKCSVAVVYVLVRQGVLPPPRIIGRGHCSRWSRKDVEQFLRASQLRPSGRASHAVA